MKQVKLYEEFVNEATTSWKRMMKGVRAGNTGPWSLVAIENYKVVAQKIDIRIMDIIPAYFEKMRKDYPKADIHIEDGTGAVVWNESIEITEALNPKEFETAVKDLAYSMPNHTSYEDVPSDEQIMKAMEKYQKDLYKHSSPSQKKEAIEMVKQILSESLTEGTYNSSKEIAIYDGEDGLTYIEKRGKGYYGYNDEFDFEATDKADLEKKLKSWKYKLISGSIDESADIKVVELFKYTEDDINMQYGFYGTLENQFDEKKVQKMYLTAINDLMKAYRISEENAIKVLDSREGRHFADFIIDGQVKNVVDAVAKYFGSGARVFNFIGNISKVKENNSVTEATKLDRDAMMVQLEDKYKFRTRPTEEFDGAKGGIWVSGENGETLGGKRIYDYYAQGSAYELGVLKKFEAAINKLGWYSEWYDAGTVMIWQD